MNILHDISDSRIKPDEFVAVIEIPKGTKKKYEIDKETGLLMLDRVTPSGMFYPMNYGFIPRTLCEDGDALDVFVLCSETLDCMTLVDCRPIGFIEMVDNGEQDEKIIAVAKKDQKFANVKDIKDISENYIVEIMHFLKFYKAHDPKNSIQLKPAKGCDEAIAVVKAAKVMYNTTGGKK